MPDVTAISFGSGLAHGNFLKDTDGPSGVANGKKLTFSGWLKSTQAEGRFMKVGRACNTTTGGAISLKFEDDTDELCFHFLSADGLIDHTGSQWHHLLFSFDLSDESKRHVYLDGKLIAGPGEADKDFFVTYENQDMKLAQQWSVGGNNNEWSGCLSEFWIDTTYIDLSDIENRKDFIRAGQAVYCGADGSNPTGSQPLYYLPLDAADAGDNLGSGGDMTVVGTLSTACADTPTRYEPHPAVTAVDFGTGLIHGNFLKDTDGPSGISNGQKLTFSGWLKSTQAEGRFMKVGRACTTTTAGAISLKFEDTDDDLCFHFLSADGVIDHTGSQWHHLLFSFDLSDSSKRHVYLDGVDIGAGGSFGTYEDKVMKLEQQWTIGGNNNEWSGCLSEFWIHNRYMDFSLPVQRLKFLRAGQAVYCGADGSIPTGFKPRYYLPLDAADPGKNLGSGGDMTVVGSLTSACADAPKRFGISVVELPPLESGSVEWWRQNFEVAVAPGAFDDVGTQVGNNPGRMRLATERAGDPHTITSVQQDKLVMQIDHNKLEYQSTGENHTEYQTHSDLYFTAHNDVGRWVPCDTNVVKWSGVIAWDGDVSISNPEWGIFWQMLDPGTEIRNPTMALEVLDGDAVLRIRYYKDLDLNDDDDDPEQVDVDPIFLWDMTEAGVADGTFHRLEIWWKLGVDDDAYWRVDLDGATLVEESGGNLGIVGKEDEGVAIAHGWYHNYIPTDKPLSTWREAYAYHSDIRVEQTDIT